MLEILGLNYERLEIKHIFCKRFVNNLQKTLPKVTKL